LSFVELPFTNRFRVFGTVQTFADLPDASGHNSELWKVNTNTGVPFFNRQYKGLYYSDGLDWSIIEFDSSAFDSIDDLQNQINSIVSENANSVLLNFPCAGNVSVGDWVISNNGTAEKASAVDISTANVIGLVETKAVDNTCSIRVAGVSAAIFSNLDTSKEYYLSDVTPGGMVAENAGIPTAPGHVLLKVGQPIDVQRFLVSKGNRVIRS
jgi:hypothetical protein